MRRVSVVLFLVLFGLPIGQSASGRPLIEGDKGWDCRTMGNRTCSTDARVAELAGIIEGQPGWDCQTMGNGDCGAAESSDDDLASLILPASSGTTERVSVSSNEEQANGSSASTTDVDVSRNGRFVVFGSFATNLVPGDTNGFFDLFVRDRLLGTTERVNVSSSEAQANDIGFQPSISADGRYVAFSSAASNLVAGDTGDPDVFVRDRQLGTTELVNIGLPGLAVGGSAPDISADGRFVAFVSGSTNHTADSLALGAAGPVLAPGLDEIDPRLVDPHNYGQVFVRDRFLRITERVSVNVIGLPATGVPSDPEGGPVGGAGNPSISADGRFVAFESIARNLVVDPSTSDDASGVNLFAADENGTDIFVRDRLLRTTDRVSLTSDGEERPGGSFDPAISGSGRFVVFNSVGDLSPDPCPGDCVYVHDRTTGLTERADVNADGTPGGFSVAVPRPSINDTGRIVTFASNAALAAEDTLPHEDIYRRDRTAGTTTLESVSSAGVQGDSQTGGWNAVSGDGRVVVFSSRATNLVENDTNGINDVFVRVH